MTWVEDLWATVVGFGIGYVVALVHRRMADKRRRAMALDRGL